MRYEPPSAGPEKAERANRMILPTQGILFLTTNHAEHIGTAFESRIHASIRYPEPTRTSRCQIWSQTHRRYRYQAILKDELDYVSNWS